MTTTFATGDRVIVTGGAHAGRPGTITGHDKSNRGEPLLWVHVDGMTRPSFHQPDILAPAGHMTVDEAAWVRENVLNRIFGLLQPRIAGQTTCLHLPQPVCSSCRHGYHVCHDRSWGDLHAGWIRDHTGSYLFWGAGGYSWCRVWTAPRPCACACPKNRPAYWETAQPPVVAAAPAPAEVAQLSLFAEVS